MKKNILYSLILMVFVACGGGGDDAGDTPASSPKQVAKALMVNYLVHPLQEY